MERIPALIVLGLTACSGEIPHAFGTDALLVEFADGEALVSATAHVTLMPEAGRDAQAGRRDRQ